MNEIKKDTVDDLIVIREVLQGHTEAFRQLVEKYQDFIYNLCYRTLGNKQEAEDVTQETFLKVYKRLADFKVDYKLSNWLYTIALNLCKNIMRKKKILRFFSLDHSYTTGDGEDEKTLDIPSGEISIESELEGKETQKRLEKLINALPDSLKIPFILRYFQNVTDDEIAEIMGLSLDNVRVRVYRAKTQLWKEFKKP